MLRRSDAAGADPRRWGTASRKERETGRGPRRRGVGRPGSPPGRARGSCPGSPHGARLGSRSRVTALDARTRVRPGSPTPWLRAGSRSRVTPAVRSPSVVAPAPGPSGPSTLGRLGRRAPVSSVHRSLPRPGRDGHPLALDGDGRREPGVVPGEPPPDAGGSEECSHAHGEQRPATPDGDGTRAQAVGQNQSLLPRRSGEGTGTAAVVNATRRRGFSGEAQSPASGEAPERPRRLGRSRRAPGVTVTVVCTVQLCEMSRRVELQRR